MSNEVFPIRKVTGKSISTALVVTPRNIAIAGWTFFLDCAKKVRKSQANCQSDLTVDSTHRYIRI